MLPLPVPCRRGEVCQASRLLPRALSSPSIPLFPLCAAIPPWAGIVILWNGVPVHGISFLEPHQRVTFTSPVGQGPTVTLSVSVGGQTTVVDVNSRPELSIRCVGTEMHGQVGCFVQ
jgi:hypothetical protein